FHTAAALDDGRVLVAGGIGEPSRLFSPPPIGEVLATTEIYDPASSDWTAGPSMSLARGGDFLTGNGAPNENLVALTATALPSGRVLIVGGGPAAEVFSSDGVAVSRDKDENSLLVSLLANKWMVAGSVLLLVTLIGLAARKKIRRSWRRSRGIAVR
ncbi:MAG: hypothetical protein ACRDIA_08230, partial [Actinomycetota bacterium]